MLSNHLICCCPLLLLPSIFPSIKVFSSESKVSSHQVANVLELQFQYQSFHEYSGLLSFKIDSCDLSVVQGILKNLFQHPNLKASIPWCLAFFMVQPSHLYLISGKTIALTICTFIGQVLSLLFNMLSRFVIAFLPRSKCLLISRLQSPYAMIWGPKKIKSSTASSFPLLFAMK